MSTKEAERMDINNSEYETFNPADVFAVFDRFHQIISVIHSTLNPEEIEKKTAHLIKSHTSLDVFLFMVFDPSKDRFVFATQKGLEPETAENLARSVIEKKNDCIQNEGIEIILEDLNKTFFVKTLKSKKQLIGCIAHEKSEQNNLSKTDTELLSVMAASVLYAYTNAKAYELTRKLAIWDNKTRLYNYRYFLQRLSNEIARARRYGRALSLIAIDLDGFKKINQQVGHITADKILSDIATLIRDSIRVVDIPSRFGGDEFFILLPETGIDGACVVVERLKSLIESSLFPLKARKDRVRVKISIGAVEYKDDMTAKEFMKAADEALYREKGGL